MVLKERTIPMYRSDTETSHNKLEGDIWVSFKGIEMQMEAWELLRLFFNPDSIHFIEGNSPELYSSEDTKTDAGMNNNEGASAEKVYLMLVKVGEDEKEWSCNASFYPEVSLEDIPDILKYDYATPYTSRIAFDISDMSKPGGKILKSRKTIIGSCIYEILSGYTGRNLPYGSLVGVRPVKLAMMCLNDGLDKKQTTEILIKTTGISSGKAELLYDIAEVEKSVLQKDESALHLYIGIPFCASRCLYCSFTAYPVHIYRNKVEAYINALIKEIEHTSKWANEKGVKIGSVYVGGGTPTAIEANSLDLILKALNSCFDIKDQEFTVEAGRPDTITEDKLVVMLENNVTRISINPQTMNSETLKLIGRNHTPEDIENKFYMAREMGFDNINMDIIAGLPGEDEVMFRRTLDKIESMSPESMTVHTMAIKRASRLRTEEPGYSPAPDYIVEAMIEEARKSASKMGMRPYYLYRQKNILANLENVGYCKPGFECHYNIHTMEEKQTIIAFGAGAISKFVFPDENRIERVFNVKDVDTYINRIDELMAKKELFFI